MPRFLFVLSRGPEDPTRVVRCFQLAKIAAEKNHDVVLFLVDDAVYLCNLGLAENVHAPTGDSLMGYLRYLQGCASILVCRPCAAARMVGEDELPQGFRIGTGQELIDLAVDARVFSF